MTYLVMAVLAIAYCNHVQKTKRKNALLTELDDIQFRLSELERLVHETRNHNQLAVVINLSPSAIR